MNTRMGCGKQKQSMLREKGVWHQERSNTHKNKAFPLHSVFLQP